MSIISKVINPNLYCLRETVQKKKSVFDKHYNSGKMENAFSKATIDSGISTKH